MSNRFLKLTMPLLFIFFLTGCPDSERLQCPGTYTLSDALDSQKRFGSSVCPKVALMNAYVEFRSASNTDLNHIFGENHPPSGNWRESIDVVFEFSPPKIVLFDPSQSKLLCSNGECDSNKLPNPLPDLMGAYNSDSETIYISSDLFVQDDDGNALNDFPDTRSAAALGVMVQELAHHYDRNFFRSANHGSEGAIAGFLLLQDQGEFTRAQISDAVAGLQAYEDDARVRLKLVDGSTITLNVELGWWSWRTAAVVVGVGVLLGAGGVLAFYYLSGAAFDLAITSLAGAL